MTTSRHFGRAHRQAPKKKADGGFEFIGAGFSQTPYSGDFNSDLDAIAGRGGLYKTEYRLDERLESTTGGTHSVKKHTSSREGYAASRAHADKTAGASTKSNDGSASEFRLEQSRTSIKRPSSHGKHEGLGRKTRSDHKAAAEPAGVHRPRGTGDGYNLGRWHHEDHRHERIGYHLEQPVERDAHRARERH